MKQSQRILLTAFLILVTFIIPLRAQGDKEKGMSDQNKTPLTNYLVSLGNRVDRYFTLEEVFNANGSKEAFDRVYIEDLFLPNTTQEKIVNIESVLENLQRTVPHFTYQISSTNPNIIHVMDSRLNQKSNYPFNNILQQIQFRGRVLELLRYISKVEPLIRPKTTIATHEMYVDFHSQVSVEGTSLSIRDILSNAVDLKNRSRILWVATTDLDSNEPSRVYYIK